MAGINKNLLQEAATMAVGAADHYHVPEGLVWGTWLGLRGVNAQHADQGELNDIAKAIAAGHHKTGRWSDGVKAASGGKVTDARATQLQKALPVKHIWLHDFPGESLLEKIANTIGISAVPIPGLVPSSSALTGAEAGAGASAAESGAAGAGGGAAATAGAAGAAGLSADLIGGGLIAAVAAIVTGYGLRLLEIIAGAGLVLFGLYTLARGETPAVSIP